VTKSCVFDNLGFMVREISAGGVVVRHEAEGWQMAVIEPQRNSGGSVPAAGKKKTSQKMLLALPKGLVDPGEKPEQTAVREVVEETGLTAVPVTKLGDIKYAYVRTWGGKERVFKIVSFYLFLYQSGEIDEIEPEMRIEVKRALWISLDDAVRKLAYGGEKGIVRRAQVYVKAHPELGRPPVT
jgi:8-oxo-dGTP pyrophosphatase MutT (NUDIX family)